MLNRSTLDQLLSSLGTSSAHLQDQLSSGAANVNQQLDDRLGDKKNIALGAGAAGLAALLMSNKKVRKMGKKAVVYGGAAALGGLAFKVLADRNKAQTADHAPLATPALPAAPEEEDRRVKLVITAMIAAANADGHVSSEERARLQEAASSLDLDREARFFLLEELESPKSVREIGRLADGPQEASEAYLASALMLDEEDPTSRRYLDDLSLVLDIDRETAGLLEQRVTLA